MAAASDPLTAFRDEPLPLQSLVCLPAGAPRTEAEATALAVDLMAPWIIAGLLLAIVVHLWLPKAMPAAERAGAWLQARTSR